MLDQAIGNLKVEIETLEKDEADGVLKDAEDLEGARKKLETAEAQAKEIEEKWNKELDKVHEIGETQLAIEQAKEKEDGKEEVEKLRSELDAKWPELEELQGEEPLVYAHVDRGVVARIIEEWTGIPAGNMMKDEARVLLDLEDTINGRVIGQPWGIKELASTIRAAKTGMTDPEKPMGVFLVTGPSGVGKTEVARCISDLLFGGEKAVTTINMSEYQDSMSVTSSREQVPVMSATATAES